jgi:hypothetical protein
MFFGGDFKRERKWGSPSGKRTGAAGGQGLNYRKPGGIGTTLGGGPG